MTTKTVAVGVDIGGTKVAAGLVDETGNVLFKTREPMSTAGTSAEGMKSVHKVIEQCLTVAEGNVAGIGVASPGPLDLRRGVVLNAPNLPCWRNFPLRDEVQNTYRLPTRIDNDANAAGLAEAQWGAGANYNSVFYATFGTGIGTAIILDQKLYYGRTGAAGEGGHMSIDFDGEAVCGCGKPGCIEGIASGPSVARRARLRAMTAPNSAMLSLAGGTPEAITTHIVEKAWRSGDNAATAVLTETMDAIAVWLGGVIDLLEPEAIVIGGGLGHLVSEWFDYLRRQISSWSINSQSKDIPLLLAKFGVDAGIVGAAALCFSEPAQIGIGARAQ